ncbi:hypothetical protein HaLaN_18450 [Haematococcus lacustris]|uniref:Uncharacterized protein n=1 Tax=Haematococcus lacustris TaxID=44745 RepID=A0A699ZEQ6_HAELA|nr:hypothetical protein HaLaN_18450 [Haematococcus lacustris]
MAEVCLGCCGGSFEDPLVYCNTDQQPAVITGTKPGGSSQLIADAEGRRHLVTGISSRSLYTPGCAGCGQLAFVGARLTAASTATAADFSLRSPLPAAVLSRGG